MSLSTALAGTDNIPGIQTIKIIDIRDVVSIPEPDANYIIQGDITLASGAAWLEIPFTLDTITWNEEDGTDAMGKATQVTVSGELPRGENVRTRDLNQMRRPQYLVLATDRNGYQRLLGNLDKGARLRWSYAPGTAPGTANRYSITLTAESIEAPYYYQGDAQSISMILYLLLEFAAGQSEAEMVITENSAGQFNSYGDSNAGTVTFEIDTGSGYAAATLPFALADGDSLKATRTDTGSAGYVELSGFQTA